MRSKLIQAFNTVLKVPEDSLLIISQIVGMLHTASLLYVWILLLPTFLPSFLAWLTGSKKKESMM